MAFVEPDMDQYDYNYDDDQIGSWGAPYSRVLDHQSSCQKLLPNNQPQYEDSSRK